MSSEIPSGKAVPAAACSPSMSAQKGLPRSLHVRKTGAKQEGQHQNERRNEKVGGGEELHHQADSRGRNSRS